jgi:MerC mercury resistance protein
MSSFEKAPSRSQTDGSINRRMGTLSPDRLGIWASAFCVIHCLLTPVLISLSAVSAHFLPSEESAHRVLAVIVAALGVIALVRGFRQHRRRRVIVLAAVGLACIWGTAVWGERLASHTAEVLITLAGSCFMIGAHRLNHTFCQGCRCTNHCD